MTIIEFRDFRPEDIADLRVLDEYYQLRYLCDDEALLPVEYATHEPGEDCGKGHDCVNHHLQSHALVFTAPSLEGKIPIGYSNFTDVNNDLSATLHFTLRPAYLKTFLKEKTYLDALWDRFRAVKVRQFRTILPAFNKLGVRLSEMMGFQRVGVLSQDVYKYGKAWDVYIFELSRADLARELKAQMIAEELEPPKVTKLTRKKANGKQKGKASQAAGH